MPVYGTCKKCGYDETIDYNCIVCMNNEIRCLRGTLDIETLRPYHDSSFLDPPSYHELDVTTLWDCPQCVERFIERARKVLAET